MKQVPLLLVFRLRLWGRGVLTLALTLERHWERAAGTITPRRLPC
jgi:hypothetical protein